MASLQPPVCCLFKDGTVWRELLVLAELGTNQWFCLNADWFFAENLSFSLTEALRCGAPVFFGQPENVRFQDEQEQLGDLPCHWLRCSANGMPLPNLLSDEDPKRFHPRSMLRLPLHGEVDEMLRGQGKGMLSTWVLQQLLPQVRKFQELVLSPRDFLLQALDLWEALHLSMSRSLTLMAAHQGQTRARRAAQRPNFGQAFQDFSDSEQEEELSEDSDGATAPTSAERQEARLKQEKERRKKLKERAEVLETLQRLLQLSWPLLKEETRSQIISHAAENIGLGLRKIFQESLSEGRDADIESIGLPRYLAQEVTQMQLGLATRQRFVSWPPSTCSMVLEAFESQTGLCRRTSTSHQFFGQIVCASSAPEELRYPIPPPSLGECQRLHLWRKVVRKLQKERAESATGSSLGTWGRLPKAAQHVTLSFLLDWTGFNSFTAVCRHLKTLCHQQASWEGIQLVASNVDFGNSGLLNGECRPLDRRELMNHWLVRYLRLGLAFEHSKQPILLGPNTTQLKRLAKAFQLRGFAWPWSFTQLIGSKSKSPKQIKGRRDDEGQLGLEPEVLLSFPEFSDGRSLHVRSEHPVLSRSLPSLGGAWFEASYAEATWIFDPKVMEGVEVFSMAFFQQIARGSSQDCLKLQIRGLGATSASQLHALQAAAAPAAAPLLQAELQGEAHGPGIYVCANSSDPELEDEEEEEEVEEEPQEQRPHWDPTGLFVAERQQCTSPQRLESSLSSVQSGDRWGLGLVKLIGGYDTERRRMLRMVGLVVLQNEKILGCFWCRSGRAFGEVSSGSFLQVSAATNSQVALAAQQVHRLPPVQDWLKALESAPVLRAKFTPA